MSVTIKELSKHLGISTSTISKALNNYPDVSSETRILVHETAKQLGYHPSSAARSLRMQRNDKLGIIHPLQSFDSEIFIAYYRGLTAAAERLGYNLVLYTAPSDDPESLRNMCRSREVGGVILMGVNATGILETALSILKEENMPFVVLGHPVRDRTINVITADFYQGALLSMQHLINSGHKRIAYMSRSEDAETNAALLRAYQESLAKAGLPFYSNYIVEAPYTAYSGQDAMQSLLSLQDPPTAVLAFNDHVAVDAAQYAKEQGLLIPEQIAFTGFGNLAYSLISSPAITTLGTPLSEMGEKALELLLHTMQNPENSEQHVFPTELIIRGSTVSQPG